MSLQLMKERMKNSGLTPRDEIIRDSVKTDIEENDCDPSFCPTFFRWINGNEPQDGEQIHPRLYDRKWSGSNGHTVQMKTTILEPINCGDVFHDTKENIWWLCIYADCIDDITYISKLVECNYCLRWQNSDLQIMEYMCWNQNSTQYNSGIKEGTTTTLTSAQHMLTLPLVKDITSLPYDKRFFLTYDYENSPFVYELTQNDMTSNKGICKITVTQTERGADDNTELGICNYIPPTLPPSEPTPDNPDQNPILLKIECVSPTVKIGSRLKTFKGIVTDLDGNVLDNVGSFSIVSDFADKIVIDTATVNQAKIKITDDNVDLVGQSFDLVFTVESVAITLTIMIEE